MYSAILLEVLPHYTNRNSSVYVLYLDASKAFDRKQRKECPLVLRFSHNLYSQPKMQVSWNGEMSNLFPVA